MGFLYGIEQSAELFLVSRAPSSYLPLYLLVSLCYLLYLRVSIFVLMLCICDEVAGTGAGTHKWPPSADVADVAVWCGLRK